MAISTVTAMVNGQTVTLNYNSSTGKYEATAVAPQGSSNSIATGYYPVSIIATDTAGNSTTITQTDSTFGDNLKLYVKEVNKPIINITSPAAGSYITVNDPTFGFTISDMSTQTSGYSGFAPNEDFTCEIYIDDEPVYPGVSETIQLLDFNYVGSNANGKGYYGTVEYTGQFSELSDGQHTLKIICRDMDENVSDKVTRTFEVDTTAPTLEEVTINGNSAETIETNTNPLTITGKTDNKTVKIKVNDGEEETVTVNANGTFSKDITLANDGNYTITITATDNAGNSTVITRSVTLNTVAPVFSSVTITPNPATGGTTYTISVQVN